MVVCDSVAVFAEGTFEEQMQELVDYIVRSMAESERSVFVQQYQNVLKSNEDRIAAGDEHDEGRRITLSLVLAEVRDIGDGSDKEIEGFFNLVYSHLLVLYPSESPQLSEKIEHLTNVITNNMSENPNLRYRLLANFFNALPKSSSNRSRVCKKLLRMFSENSHLGLLLTSATEIEKWINEWDFDREEKNDFLKLLADTYTKAGHTELAYYYSLKYVRSLSSSSPELGKAIQDIVIMALRLPSLLDFDSLLGLEGIDALQSHALHELLRVISNQDLTSYLSWESANEDFLRQYDISKTMLERKMRLLILASLGSQYIGRDLPYAVIASILQIKESQVEKWLIDVMRTGLFAGKLSQTTKNVLVIRSTPSIFRFDHWKTLEGRLMMWQEGLSGILDVVTSARRAGHTTMTDRSGKFSEHENALRER